MASAQVKGRKDNAAPAAKGETRARAQPQPGARGKGDASMTVAEAPVKAPRAKSYGPVPMSVRAIARAGSILADPFRCLVLDHLATRDMAFTRELLAEHFGVLPAQVKDAIAALTNIEWVEAFRNPGWTYRLTEAGRRAWDNAQRFAGGSGDNSGA